MLFLHHARCKRRGSSVRIALIKPNKARCALNYSHGNYNVLYCYLEPCAKLGGHLEAAFVSVFIVLLGGGGGADTTSI